MLIRDNFNKLKNCDLCYRCGKPGYFMKDCPLLKQEFSKNYHEKIAMTNPVPFKDFKRKRSADNMMRQALAAWGDSSSESEDEPDTDDDEDNGNKEDRDSLTLVLGESEQTRDELVDIVTDHKKTIEILRKEKNDLLVEIADLRETILKPWTKSKTENSGKGKEIASEEHIRLGNEVKAMRSRMCAEIEKNKQLQTNLERVKNDLEMSLKSTQRFKEDVPDNNQSVLKNKVFAEMGTMKGSGQQWFIDSGCSKYITGINTDFVSLKALQGRSVSFGNGKKGNILGVGKVGKSLTHFIENMYYVNVLKYSLLSVSQICDKGNKVEFLSKIYTVTDLVTGEIVFVTKRYKNIYVADFESL
ncbi:uncharacterized protein [Nicotiana sylvestris]|uniref:uncharacterized protein n=1 Tax=Nicotiana sylvestris TaxID=4096 RepID=UPI00388C5911